MKTEYIYLYDVEKNEIEALIPETATIEKKELVADKDCYLLVITVPGNGLNSAKTLGTIDVLLRKQKNRPYKRLLCGYSEYYTNQLYKKCNQFELKLRELLSLTVVLSNKPKRELVKLVKELDEINFGVLLYSLKYDFSMADSIREYLKEAHTKTEILEYVDSLNEKENWFVSIGLSDSKLNTDTKTIINYRNAIMHHHYVDYDNYRIINNAFDSVIRDIDEVSVFYKDLSPEEYESLVDSFTKMFAGLKRFADEIMKSAAKLVELSQNQTYQEYQKLFQKILLDENNIVDE